MRYLSVCSGIEAATVAWHGLGWTPVAFSEIDKFPSAVLAHHYPNVPNWGDMTKFKEWPDESIDVLVGGTPCQSFSVAGLRKGLADPRGNLMLTYLAIADKYRPEWLVWENVPGVLSSNGGRDFGALLGGLAELGYGFAYRILNAQFFGVAQRRRRVFLVANARSWQRAAAVLFERESLCGNPPPRRSTGQATPCLSASGSGVSRTGFNSEEQWFIPEIAGCLNSASGHAVPGNSLQDVDQGYLVPTAFDAYNQTTNSDTYHTLTEKGNGARKDAVLVPISFPWQMGGTIQMPVDEGITGALIKNQTYAVAFAKVHTIAFAQNQRDEIRTMNVVGALAAESGMKQQTYVAQPVPYDFYQITAPVNRQNREPGDPCHTLARDNAAHATIVQPMQVRRLTPRECERLQGFPDDYTLIPYRNKPAADGPRYKALGNSMAVPVMAWIGKRIQMVSEIGQDNVS